MYAKLYQQMSKGKGIIRQRVKAADGACKANTHACGWLMHANRYQQMAVDKALPDTVSKQQLAATNLTNMHLLADACESAPVSVNGQSVNGHCLMLQMAFCCFGMEGWSRLFV